MLSLSTFGSSGIASLNAVAYDDHGITAGGLPDTSLLRVDAADFPMKTFENSFVEDVATSPVGDIFIAGQFYGETNFGNEDFSPSERRDAFVASFDSSGTWRWDRVLSGTDVEARDMALDSDGNIMIAGNFSGVLDFGDRVVDAEGTSGAAIVTLHDSLNQMV